MGTVYKVLDTARGDVILPVVTNAGAPVNGTSGTFAKIAAAGTLLIDVSNTTLYQNTNTQASPTWTQLTTASAGSLTTLTVSSTSSFAGVMTVSNATQSTSTTTGAVKIAGGVGVVKDVFLGGALSVAGASTLIGAAAVSDATQSTSTTTGSLKTAGGLGVVKDAFLGGKLNVAGIVTLGSIGTGLSAAGSTRTDATALTKQFNNVGTVGSGTGVILPASAVGVPIWVFNNGANPLAVYGAGSDTIDGTAGSTGVTLTNGKSALYMCVAANTYVSMMGVVSA